MAVHFVTATPRRLLSAYKKAIDEGHVRTWSYDDDGDFTHTAEQWTGQVWLRPKVIPETELIFYILSPSDDQLSTEAYGIYHGRFIESFLNHCDKLFSSASASAMPENGDHV